MPRVKFHRFAGREFRVNTMMHFHHITMVTQRVETDRTWRVSINTKGKRTSHITRAKAGNIWNPSMPRKMEAFIRALLAMRGH